MTTIYFMRHSEPIKINNIYNNDSLQIQNEKSILSVNGEKLAKEKSEILNDYDIVFSSNYARAIATAKYFGEVNIDESFKERKFGINSWDELPSDFGEKQFNDFNYKIGDGESINEVIKREEEGLNRILDEYKNKKILIVGHGTAMAALFSKWCEISYPSEYKFNGKVFFDGKFNYCETFKLIFDDDKNLVDIERL